jgi:hypothetical protein
MKVMMVLAFMASTIVFVALWPAPLPPAPEQVHPGEGVTHVEATTTNSQRVETYRRLATRRRVRIGGAILAITVIVRVAYGIGRRLE